MSRSYKKNPVVKSIPKGKIGQKFANRRVRHYKKGLPDGGAYKKLYNQYNIHDWVTRETLGDALHWRARHLAFDEMRGWESSEEDLNINKTINRWKKHYYWK